MLSGTVKDLVGFTITKEDGKSLKDLALTNDSIYLRATLGTTGDTVNYVT